MSARDKTTKFIELANKRVNRAIRDMQLVGNLANRQNYDFTEDQAKKILKALQQEVDALKQGFLSAGDATRNDFKL